MPVELTFQDPDTFAVHASGNVTLHEIRAAMQQLTIHPCMRPGVGIIVHGREVEGVPSTMELRVIARELKALFDLGLSAVAIVADRTYVYGVARMFAAFAEALGENVHAFRCPIEARKWLEDQPRAA